MPGSVGVECALKGEGECGCRGVPQRAAGLHTKLGALQGLQTCQDRRGARDRGSASLFFKLLASQQHVRGELTQKGMKDATVKLRSSKPDQVILGLRRGQQTTPSGCMEQVTRFLRLGV